MSIAERAKAAAQARQAATQAANALALAEQDGRGNQRVQHLAERFGIDISADEIDRNCASMYASYTYTADLGDDIELYITAKGFNDDSEASARVRDKLKMGTLPAQIDVADLADIGDAIAQITEARERNRATAERLAARAAQAGLA